MGNNTSMRTDPLLNKTNSPNNQKLKISKNISNYKKQSIWNNYDTENFSSENPVNKFLNKTQYDNIADVKELMSYLSESDNNKNISNSNKKRIMQNINNLSETSPFLTSDVYKYIVNNKKLQKGGAAEESEDDSSSSSSSDTSSSSSSSNSDDAEKVGTSRKKNHDEHDTSRKKNQNEHDTSRKQGKRDDGKDSKKDKKDKKHDKLARNKNHGSKYNYVSSSEHLVNNIVINNSEDSHKNSISPDNTSHTGGSHDSEESHDSKESHDSDESSKKDHKSLSNSSSEIYSSSIIKNKNKNKKVKNNRNMSKNSESSSSISSIRTDEINMIKI